MSDMRNKSLFAIVIIPFALLFCHFAFAQDNSNTSPHLSLQPNITEVMNWLDKNGMGQARVGIRILPKLRDEISGLYNKRLTPP